MVASKSSSITSSNTNTSYAFVRAEVVGKNLAKDFKKFVTAKMNSMEDLIVVHWSTLIWVKQNFTPFYPTGVNFINIFTYEFFVQTAFRQLFQVTFWLWQKIRTKNTRV